MRFCKVRAGNETIIGPNINSTISGGIGNDTITGGTEDDTISGQAGADSLTGGSGNDTYIFNTNDVETGETITEASNGGTDIVSIITNTDFGNMSASSFDEIETIELYNLFG